MSENWFEQFDDYYAGLITANVIKDSYNDSSRLTTFVVTFPRIILPEVLTHRAFSRNTASNRAKPIKVTLRELKNYPFIPAIWLDKNKGMQSYNLASNFAQKKANFGYKLALNVSKFVVKYFMSDVSKQQANRLLEPFQYTQMVLTTSHLDNFFNLRDNQAAQFEIQVLARKMKKALAKSTPTFLKPGDLHIPYILPEEESLDLKTKLQISVARCARNSYAELSDNALTSTSKVSSDVGLFNRLLKERHMSPFEHQAVSIDKRRNVKNNFGVGWEQFRTYVEYFNPENPFQAIDNDINYYNS